jgi:hypothetical protein
MVWNISAAEYGAPPQEIIDKQLVDDCDMGIALFGNRLGTPTGPYPSGTASEIDRLSNAGKPVGVLWSRRRVDPTEINHEQGAQQLEEYLDGLSENGLLKKYKKKYELAREVQNFLNRAVAREQGLSETELAGTFTADVSPRVEAEDKVATNIPNFIGTIRSWYLVLTNRGDGEARDIRIKTEPLTEGEAWKIVTGRDEDLILTPDVERLGGKHDVIWLPIADALNMAGIVKCIVTWTDDRGEHTNTTTLQLKSSSEPAWNEAPGR